MFYKSAKEPRKRIAANLSENDARHAKKKSSRRFGHNWSGKFEFSRLGRCCSKRSLPFLWQSNYEESILSRVRIVSNETGVIEISHLINDKGLIHGSSRVYGVRKGVE